MKDNNQDPRMTPLSLYLWFMPQEAWMQETMGHGRKPNVRERQPVSMSDDDAAWLRGVGIKL